MEDALRQASTSLWCCDAGCADEDQTVASFDEPCSQSIRKPSCCWAVELLAVASSVIARNSVVDACIVARQAYVKPGHAEHGCPLRPHQLKVKAVT